MIFFIFFVFQIATFANWPLLRFLEGYDLEAQSNKTQTRIFIKYGNSRNPQKTIVE